VVLPTMTSMRRHFGIEQMVLVAIRDLPPMPLGLLWWTSHDNARIRALAEVARGLPVRT
jgi:hypothetical protein